MDHPSTTTVYLLPADRSFEGTRKTRCDARVVELRWTERMSDGQRGCRMAECAAGLVCGAAGPGGLRTGSSPGRRCARCEGLGAGARHGLDGAAVAEQAPEDVVKSRLVPAIVLCKTSRSRLPNHLTRRTADRGREQAKRDGGIRSCLGVQAQHRTEAASGPERRAPRAFVPRRAGAYATRNSPTARHSTTCGPSSGITPM